MVLVFTHIISPRLTYITNFLFNTLLGVECRLTNDPETYANFEGVKINYSHKKISAAELHISAHPFMQETGIRPQEISYFSFLDHKAFFKTENGDLPFDIFSAAFYLLSRYEEYLPHKKDSYGRFAHQESIAFKENFLSVPLVNAWANYLGGLLLQKFGQVNLHPCQFSFLPTYDIDIAYSYKYKGLIRNLGGIIRSPSLERLRVLAGLSPDPFDSYAWIDEVHRKYKLEPVYFFLMGRKNGVFDKHILPGKEAMRKLIQQHSARYQVGIHPSWQSGDNHSLLQKEKRSLETITGKTVTSSRQHYIRFNLPGDYRRLISAGITDDYSMGYGSINGFRASVATSFFWYDLEKEHSTDLLVHPFCFMEANSYYEQHLTASEAGIELNNYYNLVKAVGGQLITIWHNNFLGTDSRLLAWRNMYLQFISRIPSTK